jgi:hypothetical protein
MCPQMIARGLDNIQLRMCLTHHESSQTTIEARTTIA